MLVRLRLRDCYCDDCLRSPASLAELSHSRERVAKLVAASQFLKRKAFRELTGLDPDLIYAWRTGRYHKGVVPDPDMKKKLTDLLR